MGTISRIWLSTLVCLLLLGCNPIGESWTDPFGWKPDEAPPLRGKRIAILMEEQVLSVDKRTAALPFDLPSAQTNSSWLNPAHNAEHVIPHLALGTKLQKIWSRDVGSGSRSWPAPAQVIGALKVIYALSEGYVVSALELDSGKVLWETPLPVPDYDEDSYGGGLVFQQGQLFASTGFGRMFALRAQDGTILWQTRTAGPSRGAPAASERILVHMAIDNTLEAFDPQSGQRIWSHTALFETTGIADSSHPAISKGKLIAPLSSGELITLTLQNARQLWGDRLVPAQGNVSLSSMADITTMPVIWQGLVLASSHAGVFAAIDERLGSRIWEKPIASGQTPAVDPDYVYVITNSGVLIALSLRGGQVRWIVHLNSFLSSIDEDVLRPRTWYGPRLAGGRLLILNNEGHLLEINPKNGRFINIQSLDGEFRLPPIVLERTLLVFNTDGVVTAYR